MRAWTDKRVEQVVGILLRAGVILAAAVVLAGGTIHLARHGSAFPDYRVFHGEPAELRHVSGIVAEAFRPDGRGLIQLGLLLLIATPVARVAFSVVAFALQKDRTYIVVTLIVLAALLYGLAGAGP
ncbi:MAG: DUF1634 domain-containing protein [Deltaproteobacteria bacterium]|nr:DUF1634 domain-containing protein [Deltaproteobacteria bacterium]